MPPGARKFIGAITVTLLLVFGYTMLGIKPWASAILFGLAAFRGYHLVKDFRSSSSD